MYLNPLKENHDPLKYPQEISEQQIEVLELQEHEEFEDKKVLNREEY
jgi:hypothetical protein